MEKVFIKEYSSQTQNKTAMVSKVINESCFVVDCYENNTLISSDIYHRQRWAEDLAQRWCKDSDPSDSRVDSAADHP